MSQSGSLATATTTGELLIGLPGDDSHAYVDVKSTSTLADVRQLILQDFDDDVLLAQGFYFVLHGTKRIFPKQEGRNRVWDFVGKGIVIHLSPKESVVTSTTITPRSTNNNNSSMAGKRPWNEAVLENSGKSDNNVDDSTHKRPRESPDFVRDISLEDLLDQKVTSGDTQMTNNKEEDDSLRGGNNSLEAATLTTDNSKKWKDSKDEDEEDSSLSSLRLPADEVIDVDEDLSVDMQEDDVESTIYGEKNGDSIFYRPSRSLGPRLGTECTSSSPPGIYAWRKSALLRRPTSQAVCRGNPGWTWQVHAPHRHGRAWQYWSWKKFTPQRSPG